MDFPVAVWGRPRFLIIITIDDVIFWSKLDGRQAYSMLLILFHKWTIFKMLAQKQLADK